MKFKDIFARWAKGAAGRPQSTVTEQDRILLTQELEELMGYLDMAQNKMQFKDLTIKTKTVNVFDQEVTLRITFNKSGNGALILRNMQE